TQLTAAKNAGADDLLGGGHFTDGVLVMQQLSGVGWTPKLISLLVAVTEPSVQAQLPGVSNNVTGPSQWERSVVFTPAIASAAGVEWCGPRGAESTPLDGHMVGPAEATWPRSGPSSRLSFTGSSSASSLRPSRTALT